MYFCVFFIVDLSQYELNLPNNVLSLSLQNGLKIGKGSGSKTIQIPKLQLWPPGASVAIWPPGCATGIATLPWISLLALSVFIELVSSSARGTSVKFQKSQLQSVSYRRTDIRTRIGRTPGTPGSDKNYVFWHNCPKLHIMAQHLKKKKTLLDQNCHIIR